MTQLGFFIDLTKCTGCQTCTVACKDAHNLEVGRNFRKVLEAESGTWKQDRATGAWHQDVRAYYVSISCNHCADPACVKVCPTEASHVAEDGTIQIDKDKCIGCQFCAMACPYGVRYLNEEERVVEKCTLCKERTDEGDEPMCVRCCPADARIFGDLDDPDSAVSRLRREQSAEVLLEEKGTRPQVFYVR